MRPVSLVLASGNAKKLAEIDVLLSPLGLKLIAQTELGVSEAPEPHPTFLENALAKARHAAACTGMAALADDSGLCVDALGGWPGVKSARWAALHAQGSGDADNNALLLQQMSTGQPLLSSLAGRLDPLSLQTLGRGASFVCVLVALRSAEDPEPLVAMGRWSGRLLDSPVGEGGFGYDPLLWIDSEGQSVAQMPAARKNQISHRAQALATMASLMRTHWMNCGP